MDRFAFVVLHYRVIEETINCVESIVKNIDTTDYTIIVVDNGSANGTGEQLAKIYKERQNIVVLLNKENLGFSRGHNTGFMYAKKNLSPQFIALMNNDTLIIQNDFCKTVRDEYDKSHFAAMGPQIHLCNGISDQNPMGKDIIRGWALWKMTALMYIKMFLGTLYLDFIILFIQTIKRKLKKVTLAAKNDLRNTRVEDHILHGCCIIFSRDFIDNFDGLDPRPFLYMEEEILYVNIKTRGLLTVYNPNLKIYHVNDASTNSVYSEPHRKRMFMYRTSLQALAVYRKILHENGL
jgi:GT2 family glycosyltransferase